MRFTLRELFFDWRKPLIGGVHTLPPGSENDPETVELARFAVAEHNWHTNAAVEFERLVKVRQQAVGGFRNYLTIEAREGKARKLYKAVVLQAERELEDFKPLGKNTLYRRLWYLNAYRLLPEWCEDVAWLPRDKAISKLIKEWCED